MRKKIQKSLSSSVTPNLKSSIILAEELGLGIEISRIPNLKTIDSDFDSTILQLQKELSNFSGYKTLHAMFFDINVASKDTAIKEISKKRHLQSFKTAQVIGADIVVFHSGNKGMKHKISQNRFIDQSILFWKEFIKHFEDSSITAVIENVHERDYNLISDIIHGVNSPNLKMSLDTGHANLFSEIKISEWIKAYGKNLRHLHIHNNYGDDDSHNGLLDGTIDFTEVLNSIMEQEISPTFVFEIFNKEALLESLKYFNTHFEEKLCLKK